jgi:hypothetical protein
MQCPICHAILKKDIFNNIVEERCISDTENHFYGTRSYQDDIISKLKIRLKDNEHNLVIVIDHDQQTCEVWRDDDNKKISVPTSFQVDFSDLDKVEKEEFGGENQGKDTGDFDLNVEPQKGAQDNVDALVCNGELVDMGTKPQALAEKKVVEMFSELITDEQKQNRTILREVMESVGFVWYPGEWWHYCYGDRMWAVYTEQKECFYGPIQNIK